MGLADLPGWDFITNHGGVLVAVFRQPRVTAREISQQLGITERTVLKIVAELDEAGYITRSRQGRTNTYAVNQDRPLHEPILKDIAVGDLLSILRAGSVEMGTDSQFPDARKSSESTKDGGP